MEQELPTLLEDMNSPPAWSEVRVARSLVFCVMFCWSLFTLLTIVLSVLLRFTASDYPFGILWPLYCLFFYDLRLLITSLVSSNFPYIIHLYLSTIVLFSSFFCLYLLPSLFWIISWLYYYTLFYLHHYYYYFHLLSILRKNIIAVEDPYQGVMGWGFY